MNVKDFTMYIIGSSWSYKFAVICVSYALYIDTLLTVDLFFILNFT